MRTVTYDEWEAEGRALYGTDKMQWKFRCPMCGHVARVQDWRDAAATIGVSASTASIACVGTLLPLDAAFDPRRGPGPCNYDGRGPFRLNPVTVVRSNTQANQVFEFADHVE